MGPSRCPEFDNFEALREGPLSRTEVERLAHHLGQCESCAGQVGALLQEATPVGVLQSRIHRSSTVEEESAVQTLIVRLKALPDAAVTVGTSSGSTDETAEVIAQLAPPQGPGEMARLGLYRLRRLLGAGGMALVFEAEDGTLGRTVALKVMRPSQSADSQGRERFLREARATAALRHDHVVTIFQAGEEKDVPYIAMELLSGESLADRLERPERLTGGEVIRLARQIAEGLEAAHAAGIVHRDVKPSIIWLDAAHGGRVKLLDFGLARPETGELRLTRPGLLLGTPSYMAPEQARDEPVDHRADLFSLGCVLYEMGTGRSPFRGTNTFATLTALAVDTPDPMTRHNPEVPAALSRLVQQLLAKDPAQRPQTAREVVETLQRIEPTLTSNGTSTASLPGAVPTHAPSGRRWAWRIAAAVVFLGVIGGFAAQIVIRIKDKDGRETKMVVPKDGTVSIEKDGKVIATVPPQPVSAPLDPSPLDALKREKIPAYELAMAGGGDPKLAPSGLVAVLGDSRLKHWQGVWSVAFHPEGRHLASGGADRVVRIWDLETGKEVRALRCSGPVFGVVYSPDGQRIAAGESGGNGRIKVWDARTGVLEQELQGHKNSIFGLSFRPDGKRLASASTDQTAKVWDVEKGQLLFTLVGHTDYVRSIAYSPDGKCLATGSSDNSIKFWDADQGGEALATLQGHTQWVSSVVFSPDGKYLASGSWDRTVRLWDVKTRQEAQTIVKTGGLNLSLAFSPDGTLLAKGDGTLVAKGDDSESGVLLLDVRTNKVSRVFAKNCEVIHGVAFSKDGRRLAAGSHDGSVRVWDVATGDLLQTPAGHYGAITQLAGSSDQRSLASSSSDTTVRLWDLATGQEMRCLGHRSSVRGVAWGADTQSLYSCRNKAALECWDARTGELLRAFPLAGINPRLAIRPSGKQIAVALFRKDEAQVKVLDGDTGKELHGLPLQSNADAGAMIAVAYSPDGKRLAAAYDLGVAKVWDADTGAEVCTVKNLATSGLKRWSLAISPDSKQLALPGTPTTVSVRDLATGMEIAAPPLPFSRGVAYSPDGRLLAACNGAGMLILFDAASGKPVQKYQLPGEVTSLLFDATSRYLFTGNGNGTIYVLRVMPGR
jgi:WD40 repeat protein